MSCGGKVDPGKVMFWAGAILSAAFLAGVALGVLLG